MFDNVILSPLEMNIMQSNETVDNLINYVNTAIEEGTDWTSAWTNAVEEYHFDAGDLSCDALQRLNSNIKYWEDTYGI